MEHAVLHFERDLQNPPTREGEGDGGLNSIFLVGWGKGFKIVKEEKN